MFVDKTGKLKGGIYKRELKETDNHNEYTNYYDENLRWIKRL